MESNDTKVIGVFKKKLFGGFAKKDVFAYVDNLKSEHKSEQELMQKELDTMNEKMRSYSEIAKQKDSVISQIRTELLTARDEFDRLSDKAREIDAANEKRIEESNSEIEKMAFELEEEKRTNEELKEKNNQLVTELDNLKDVAKQLGEKLVRVGDLVDQKQKIDELTRKAEQTLSEYEIMKNAYSIEKQKNEKYENALRKLASFDYAKLDSLSGSLSDLSELSRNIRIAVFDALEICDNSDFSTDKKPEEVKNAEIDDLIELMNKQFGEVDKLISSADE